MTRSEQIKNELMAYLGGASMYWGFENPFNTHRSHDITVWVMPPEVPVVPKGVPFVLQMEVRTTLTTFDTKLETLKKNYPVFDVVEQYLPKGALGVDNTEGYLYKFKVRMTLCCTGLSKPSEPSS